MTDPVLRMLERLPEITPDEARARRVRARCREALTRQHTQPRPRESPPTSMWEPALVGVCLVYLIEIAREVWRIERLF
jgi:hypothetical protein